MVTVEQIGGVHGFHCHKEGHAINFKEGDQDHAEEVGFQEEEEVVGESLVSPRRVMLEILVRAARAPTSTPLGH